MNAFVDWVNAFVDLAIGFAIFADSFVISADSFIDWVNAFVNLAIEFVISACLLRGRGYFRLVAQPLDGGDSVRSRMLARFFTGVYSDSLRLSA